MAGGAFPDRVLTAAAFVVVAAMIIVLCRCTKSSSYEVHIVDSSGAYTEIDLELKEIRRGTPRAVESVDVERGSGKVVLLISFDIYEDENPPTTVLIRDENKVVRWSADVEQELQTKDVLTVLIDVRSFPPGSYRLEAGDRRGSVLYSGDFNVLR